MMKVTPRFSDSSMRSEEVGRRGGATGSMTSVVSASAALFPGLSVCMTHSSTHL